MGRKVGNINEDYFFISFPDDPVQIYIVADGMGGYNGGEVASRLAVDTAKKYILSNYEKVNKNRESLIELVKNSTQYANMVVYEKAQSRKELNKMGTTLDVCLIHQNRAFISHIGDSRIYRLRKEFFRRLTKDHSYVQQLVDEGKISKQESLNHPDKNMLMKALGVSSFIEPDAMVKGFLKGDVILMCSDGLSNMVDRETIYEIVQENFETAPKKLINIANQNGGLDNITVITIKNL